MFLCILILNAYINQILNNSKNLDLITVILYVNLMVRCSEAGLTALYYDI